MDLRPINLGLRSKPARDGYAGAARLLNCYAENVGEEGKTPWNIHSISGYDDFATLTNGTSVRAMLALTDADLYAVSGRLVFRIDTTGTVSVLGGLPSDGLVTMARNRKAVPEIAIVCDGLVFKIVSGVLSQVSDADLPPATSVTSLNGYFVFQIGDGRMFSSELDEINVLPTDFAAASSDPDNARRVFTRGQDLISFGTKSMEFWQDQGGAEFPFGRVTSREVGLLAAGAVASVDQTVIFVAHDNTVRQLQGYDTAVISDHRISRLIEGEASKQDITAFGWYEHGHTFAAISGTDWTVVYDATTQLWHDRESANEGRWRICSAISFANGTVFGDYENGKLYRLNEDTHTEAGAEFVASIVTPPVTNGGRKFTVPRLEVDMLTGVGLVSATEYKADPQLMIDYTRDGKNFSTQRFRSMGRAGQSRRKVYCTGLGQHDSVSFRLGCSAPVKRTFLGAMVGVA